MFNAHPSSTGGDGRQIRYRSPGQPNESSDSGFVRCYQCGMLNDLNKVQHGDSFDRNKDFVVTSSEVAQDGSTQTIVQFDDAAMGGCRFCHSTNIEGTNRFTTGARKPPAGFIGG